MKGEIGVWFRRGHKSSYGQLLAAAMCADSTGNYLSLVVFQFQLSTFVRL